jgi:hypothetical protein
MGILSSNWRTIDMEPQRTIRQYEGHTTLSQNIAGAERPVGLIMDGGRRKLSVLEIVAHHEAGHIVVGAAAGAQLQSVVLGCDRGRTVQLVKNRRQSILITSAGKIAGILCVCPEMINAGTEIVQNILEDLGKDPGDDDSMDLKRYAAEVAPEELISLLRLAYRSVRKNWRAIVYLADCLRDRAAAAGVLSGNVLKVPANMLELPVCAERPENLPPPGCHPSSPGRFARAGSLPVSLT